MRLTKEDVCLKDNPKEKENITCSKKTKREHLTFSKTVRQDERKKTSKKEDTRI